jgi:thiopeptide-type bacteriocin biosynthesis protein
MIKYLSPGFFLFRSPVMPIKSIMKLNEALNRYEQSQNQLDFDVVKDCLADNVFQEGIYLASKEMFKLLNDWVSGVEYDKNKIQRLIKSLHKYYSRMSTRSTPYGLFAGCCLGTVTENPTILDLTNRKFRKNIRFDSNFAIRLAEFLSKDLYIKSKSKYYANTSMYTVGDKNLYIEYALKTNQKSYSLSAVTNSIYIENVLAKAKIGSTFDELVNCVILEGVDKQDISNFIDELINSQILVSELSYSVTGEEYLSTLVGKLKYFNYDELFIKQLEEILDCMNFSSFDLSKTIEIDKKINSLKTPKFSGEILQSDLYYESSRLNINSKVIDEISIIAQELQSLISPFVSKDLENFRVRFAARFEEREVALAQALDPDTGVGYSLAVNGNTENMPLLDGIIVKPVEEDKLSTKYNFIQTLVNKVIKSFYQNRESIYVISDEDVKKLNEINRNLTTKITSSYVFGNIVAKSSESVDQGDYKFYPYQLHTPYASKLFSRFAHGSVDIKKEILELCAFEQDVNPHIILAEVAYLPEGHAANLVSRPTLRNYEISYLSLPTIPDDKALALDDLMISIRNNRVVIRSKKLNKEVMPMLSNSYNPKLGQPLYKFLADIESQHCKLNFVWNWGVFSDEPFLPRIEYKKFILSRARWNISKKSFERLTYKQSKEYLFKIRSECNIPRYVYLSQGGDNELFVDLDNSIGQDHIIQYVKKSNVFLYEVLQNTDSFLVNDGKDVYTSEIILPFNVDQPLYQDKISIKGQSNSSIERIFAPGSEWTYFKLYGGNKILEYILVELITPLLTIAVKNGGADSWFFIRYNDPENHIRVRVHKGKNEMLWQNIVTDISETVNKFIYNEQIVRLTLDTYVREVERYGRLTMENSETIFFVDSVAVVSCLNLLMSNKDETQRWQIALFGIDQLLNDFGYSLEDKCFLLKKLYSSFLNEFAGNEKSDVGKLEFSLDKKYRSNAKKVHESILEMNNIKELNSVINFFSDRSTNYKPAIAEIKNKLSDQMNNYFDLDYLISSYIHMFMNRLMLSRRREHELVVYHHLSKFYITAVAKSKKK